MFANGHSLGMPSESTPWMLVTPFLLILAGFALKTEKVHIHRILGLFLAIGGISGILVQNIEYQSLFMFAHAVFWAIAVIIWRKLIVNHQQDPLLTATWSLFGTTLGVACAYIVSAYLRNTDFFHDLVAMERLVMLVFMVSLANAANYIVIAFAIHESSIFAVAIYVIARPFMTTAIIVLFDRPNKFFNFCMLGLLALGVAICSYQYILDRKSVESNQNKENEQIEIAKNLNKELDVVHDRPIKQSFHVIKQS